MANVSLFPDATLRLDIHVIVDDAAPLETDKGVAAAETGDCRSTALLSPSSHPQPTPPPLSSAGWMSRLSDDVLLSELSIPGTHDSCARIRVPYVRTQNLKISQQLGLGVRALDLRLRRKPGEGNRLYCYHGGVPLGPGLRALPLDTVMAEVWAFLEGTGRTETVLISVDNDDPADGRDPEGRRAFYRAMADFVAATPPWPGDGDGEEVQMVSRWFAEPRTPCLGEVRGRAVLLRRFGAATSTGNDSGSDDDGGSDEDRPGGLPPPPLPPSLGLDLSAWVNDNPDFTIVTPHGRFRVQDKWDYPNRISLQDLVTSKTEFVRSMLDLATAGQEPPRVDEGCSDWYINFCSAVGEPSIYGEISEAKAIAVGSYTNWGRTWVEGVNVTTCDYVRQKLQEAGNRGEEPPLRFSPSGMSSETKQRFGIVYMDYPELPEDNGLVQLLISSNF